MVSLKETQNRKAAKAAMELDSLVQALGWEQGLAKFRGDTPTPRNNLTLGDYLLEVAVTGEITPRTLRTYTTKVRRIAADIGEICLRGKLNKYDYVNGGTKAWQDLVDAVPLRALSPDAVRTWLTAYLLPSQGNPAKRESAIKSANSCIRAGKAIFAAKILERLTHLVLPDPIPFSGMRTRREEITRYRSEIADPKQLLVAGMKELAHATMDSQNQALWELGGCEGPAPEPAPGERIRAGQAAFRMREAFKVLILSLSAGLRRGELDRLQWNQRKFHIHKLRSDSSRCDSMDDIQMGDISTARFPGASAIAVEAFLEAGIYFDRGLFRYWDFTRYPIPPRVPKKSNFPVWNAVWLSDGAITLIHHGLRRPGQPTIHHLPELLTSQFRPSLSAFVRRTVEEAVGHMEAAKEVIYQAILAPITTQSP